MSGYPISAYRQLFPNGEPILPFDPAEDGDHYRPEPNFFEWWYFDAAFDDGSYLVAILHSSLYNAVDHKPTLDLRYYPPEGGSVVAVERFNRSAYSAAPDRCRVKIGDCLVVDKEDRYQISLRQKSIEAELIFWPQLPGWRAGTGHLFANAVTGHYFDWIVPLPRARVEGVLTINGQRRAVAGVGYHDHNWGNLYLPAAFSRWTWGRVLAGDWTVIFGDVVGRGKTPSHVTPLMLARGDEILLATDCACVRGESPAQEPHTGAAYFRRLHVTTEERPAVKLTLTAPRPVEALNFAAPRPPLARRCRLRGVAEAAFYLLQDKPVVGRVAARLLGRGSYLRLQSDYTLSLPDYAVAKTGRMLYEVMGL